MVGLPTLMNFASSQPDDCVFLEVPACTIKAAFSLVLLQYARGKMNVFNEACADCDHIKLLTLAILTGSRCIVHYTKVCKDINLRTFH